MAEEVHKRGLKDKINLKKIILGTVGPGSIVGEMSLLTWKPAVASVVVKTDSEIWQISREKFFEFLEKHPHLKEQILKIIEERQKINEQKLKEAQEPLASSDDNNLDQLKLDIYL